MKPRRQSLRSEINQQLEQALRKIPALPKIMNVLSSWREKKIEIALGGSLVMGFTFTIWVAFFMDRDLSESLYLYAQMNASYGLALLSFAFAQTIIFFLVGFLFELSLPSYNTLKIFHCLLLALISCIGALREASPPSNFDSSILETLLPFFVGVVFLLFNEVDMIKSYLNENLDRHSFKFSCVTLAFLCLTLVKNKDSFPSKTVSSLSKHGYEIDKYFQFQTGFMLSLSPKERDFVLTFLFVCVIFVRVSMMQFTPSQEEVEYTMNENSEEVLLNTGDNISNVINRIEVVAYRFVKDKYRNPKYVEYKVLILQAEEKKKIYKRFTAFKTLRKNLGIEFNLSKKLPKLPQKGIGRCFEARHLERRALKLNLFLQELFAFCSAREIVIEESKSMQNFVR